MLQCGSCSCSCSRIAQATATTTRATAINSNKCGMVAWKIFIKSNNALSSGSAIIQRATFCGKLGKFATAVAAAYKTSNF